MLDHVIHRPVGVFIKVVLILVAIVIVGFKSLQIATKKVCPGDQFDGRTWRFFLNYAHNLPQGFPTVGTNFSNCSVQVRQKHGDRCIYCQCRVAPDGGDYRRPGASGLSEQQPGVLQSSTRVQP